MKKILTALLLCSVFTGQAQINHQFTENKSFSHAEAIEMYRQLDDRFAIAQLEEIGTTDIGRPLHAFVIDRDKNFDPAKTRQSGKRVLLVNNGIHPGESCGIDASIWWAEQLLTEVSPLLENTVVVIIPVYNVGGALNRGCCSRTNQDGPELYGFRGNAKNLDLNRDFIKCDSKNAESFTKLFHRWNPDVFVDTHTTNGADYQYTMTLIAPNKDKMDPLLGAVTENDVIPFLYNQMDSAGFPMIPYVSTRGGTPETGIVHFPDGPRYSSGYVNLFHTLGFTSEAHMLKPFEDRVRATAAFLQSLLEMTDKYGELIGQLRQKALEKTASLSEVPMNHRVDTTEYEMIDFKGYEFERKTSPVTGHEQVYYNKNQPYTKSIRYYKRLTVGHTSTLPDYYIIPQAWEGAIDRLKWNKVEMSRLKSDQSLVVEVDYITDYTTVDDPYEGHYLHREVKTKTVTDTLQFFTGDYVIATNQPANIYLAHVLDPVSDDSFFNWNFFDAVLMQKEWFSSYVFDLEAEQLLEENPELRARFLTKKQDPKFAEDPWAQLYYLYQQTDHYEKTHNRYPVARYSGTLKKGILE